MWSQIGKYLILAGLILLIAGVIIYFAGEKLNWFGNLPGDIKIKKENFTLYAPLASMLILSIILSFLIWVVSKLR
jgi:hypothetical protein